MGDYTLSRAFVISYSCYLKNPSLFRKRHSGGGIAFLRIEKSFFLVRFERRALQFSGAENLFFFLIIGDHSSALRRDSVFEVERELCWYHQKETRLKSFKNHWSNTMLEFLITSTE